MKIEITKSELWLITAGLVVLAETDWIETNYPLADMDEFYNSMDRLSDKLDRFEKEYQHENK